MRGMANCSINIEISSNKQFFRFLERERERWGGGGGGDRGCEK